MTDKRPSIVETHLRPYEERESITETTRRVPARQVEDAIASELARSDIAPAPAWPLRVELSLHESAMIYFQGIVENFGQVRLQTTREGIELWLGDECRWRSWGG